MAAVQPFRALRYNAERIADVSPVLAPPYDVIDAPEQERLYQASPYNVVRLILGKQSPTDTPQDDRYTRARRDFDAWRAERLLVQDPASAFYLLEHAFADAGRRRCRLGFLALLALTDSMDGSVYRHEATLAAPKEDRRRLLEAVPAHLSPIFCVYPDAQGAIQERWQRLAAQSEPLVQARLYDDELRMWIVTDPTLIQEVTERLASAAVLIADGHHRFEVAYAHRDRCPAVLGYFVSMDDPSLVVRPIHRIVHHGGGPALPRLRELCTLEPAPDLSSLTRWLGAEVAGARGCFGYYEHRTFYRATVREERLARWLTAPPPAEPRLRRGGQRAREARDAAPPPSFHHLRQPRKAAWGNAHGPAGQPQVVGSAGPAGGGVAPPMPLAIATLDVAILHGLLLPSLGVSSSSGGVRYTADPAQAIRDVDQDEGRSAWLLRGIPLSQVYALAAQGLTLPPKSTYFYPKVPSGLVINPF